MLLGKYQKRGVSLLKCFENVVHILTETFSGPKVNFPFGPGGEIGRRTGLKILGPLPDVPVQVWPGAPQVFVDMNLSLTGMASEGHENGLHA